MNTVRPTAVAGMFYPDDPQLLQREVSELLLQNKTSGPRPFAMVLPHAGYSYSGGIAASGYSLLKPYAADIKHIFLLGPSHKVYIRGMAISSAKFFTTPLGDIAIDQTIVNHLVDFEQVEINDSAHSQEHSLEVHLPFLQTVLDQFSLVPIVVGDCDAKTVEAVIEHLTTIENSLFIISSDLSHFLSYNEAQTIDQATSQAIEQLKPTLEGHQACGCKPLNGMLLYAQKHELNVKTLTVKNSGDTAGSPERVVGYGAYVIY